MRIILSALMVVTVLVCGCMYLPGCTAAKSPPVITSFNASPASIDQGGSSTLSWTVTGAKSVSLDNGIGNVAVKGTRAIAPAATTVYILTASNAAGSSTASTQVAVSGTATSSSSTETGTAQSASPSSSGTPAINSFGASPGSITAGASSTLSWSVANATSINIQPGIGNVAASGSTAVTPGSSTQFILTATNSSGSNQASTRVIVATGTTGAASGTTDTSSGTTGTATAPATFAGPVLQLDPVAPPPLNDFHTIYDFVEKAPSADWINNDTYLTFPGKQDDSRGFAIVLLNATLEDNKVYPKVLEMHPPWRTDGFLWGNYTELAEGAYTPKAADHFTAKVGFLKGATAGNVQFSVLIRSEGEHTYTGEEINKTYNGELKSIDVPLANYAGKKISIDLKVKARNADAKQAWAVWVNPRIITTDLLK